PPMESIQTVNISTNNFDAEQGMAGGAAVSVITKSGTNQIHGAAFEYHSNHLWGAKNLFFNPNTPAGPNIPQRIDNQFGGAVGGPIRKNQLFFFASWEGTTTAERGNGLLSVPTDQVRSGNFSGLTTVYDPTTGDSSGRNRTPFAGNVVPQNMWSFASRTLQDMIPLPNTGTGQSANYFASVPYYFKRNLVDGKLNWTPNSKANVFLKYSAMLAPVTGGAPLGKALGAYPGGAAGDAGIGTGHNHTDIFGGGISYVITPTVLFDANFGGTLMHHDTTGPDYGTNYGSDVLKIPGTNGSDPRQSGFPIFNISGYTSLGNVNNWSPVERNDRLYTYSANVNWVHGSHSVRAGLDYVHHQMNHWQPEIGSYGPRGGFNFVNGVTALNGGASPNNFNAYAAFLLGLPGSFGHSYQFYDPMSTREFQQGYYIRDNWQASRKLSVNLGLRVEHYPIMNRGQYGIERWDPDTNKVLIGGRGNVPRDAGSEAALVMWAPRIGFAYRATEKTVVRAGFGITNDPYPLSRPMRSPFPAVISDEYNPANSFVSAGSLATGIPAVKFPDLSTGIIDIPNTVATNSLLPGKFRRGYIESFNFTVQRELGAGFVLQTGYVGTRSIRQELTYFEMNAGILPGAGANGRPYFLKFGVNTNRRFLIPMATNRYDAWQTNLTKRFSHGLFLTSSFTWSKALGINAGNSDSGLSFYVPSQYSKNKAVIDFDRTLTWTSAANWELPFGKGKRLANNGVAAAIAGGWQLNPTVALYTGRPFTVTADGSSLNAPQNTQVADQVNSNVTKMGGVGLGSPFYDPSAFAPISDVRFGNMGLNALRGPRLFNMNMGLSRKFNLKESVSLRFQAEALNFTNTPALNNPNASVSTPSNFMRITSTISTVTSAQRTIRLGLRLGF
ncbi:MAG TPA: TonB-dependent receptor, partial [Candidatus Solibacter sp.]|nr:TonB-dependent receptor [Candidatus Solibacter sp.]